MNSVAYVAYSKSRKVLKHSSSGGVFFLLAKYYLKELNGVVYGATTIGKDVFHIRVDKVKDIKKIQKSKYVRSDLRNTFFECKNDILIGKKVLFVGLPCQINSLVTYLKQKNVDTSNLMPVDLICHGVPNKKVLDDYLFSNFNNEIIKNIDFRFKKPFWEDYYIKIRTNKRKYVRYKFQDDYLSNFLNGCNLDDSCYKCTFKGDNRKSLITLGDFWGIKKLYPKYYNNRGTSLMIVHDLPNLLTIMNYLHKKAFIREVSLIDAIKFNNSYLEPAKKTLYDSNAGPRLKNRTKRKPTIFLLKYFCKRK